MMGCGVFGYAKPLVAYFVMIIQYPFGCVLPSSSEALLDAHEAEVARLRAFYDQRMKVYFSLENWTQLWDQFVEFEKRANDPNRFSKRGGGLLQVSRSGK